MQAIPRSISGPVVSGEVIRVRNWDGRGGMLVGKVGDSQGKFHGADSFVFRAEVVPSRNTVKAGAGK